MSNHTGPTVSYSVHEGNHFLFQLWVHYFLVVHPLLLKCPWPSRCHGCPIPMAFHCTTETHHLIWHFWLAYTLAWSACPADWLGKTHNRDLTPNRSIQSQNSWSAWEGGSANSARPPSGRCTSEGRSRRAGWGTDADPDNPGDLFANAPARTRWALGNTVADDN